MLGVRQLTCLLLSLLRIALVIQGVVGLPIRSTGPGRTNIIVSLDPLLPLDVYASHLGWVDLVTKTEVNILREFSVGTMYRGYLASVELSMFELLLSALAEMPEVLHAEPDIIGHVDEVESGAPWGLGRISHRYIETDMQYQQYIYNADAGKGVKVYLLDTGVYSQHSEFQREREGLLPPTPRAQLVKNFVASEQDDRDLYGHGTHCAGTIGGNKYGVAKSVDIDVIKVCNRKGECQMSDIISGLEYVVSRFLNSADNPASKGSLISMSLGLPSDESISLALATKAAIKSGILIVASAGNSNQNACTHTPASVEEVLTVGATSLNDTRAKFSNYGQCVDVFAPGDNILSASTNGKYKARVMSGTSMSTPHVAGLVAYYMALADDGVFTTPEFIKAFIMSRSTPNIVLDAKGSRNLMVFNG